MELSSLSPKLLVLSYAELEERNLAAKQRELTTSPEQVQKEVLYELEREPSLKAVTIAFSDIEGRFHMLDYDKNFLLRSWENLTFDGSSVRGYSTVDHSDLRLLPDWGSMRWMPADLFGAGKVLMFASICDQNGASYGSDMRSKLAAYCGSLRTQHGYTTNVAVECEGFLLAGTDAEQHFAERGFELVSTGGYYNSLPRNPLRQFIDKFADVQRAMGFENEKDHPEVAPSQFELNYRYTAAVQAADQLQLYKLLARQIAATMGMTASFLPKPVAGINGSGMHCNVSLSKNGTNAFYDADGEYRLSPLATGFFERLLYSANDLSLAFSPSVNAYRRQDPAYEAPNQIKVSASDRTSMVRVPLGNEKSARIEVRTVAPDANPYLVFFLLFKIGMEGPVEDASANTAKRSRTRVLPPSIQDAMRHFKNSEAIAMAIGEDAKEKYLHYKKISANRCPRELGATVKASEVLFHHEVTNQYLWSKF